MRERTFKRLNGIKKMSKEEIFIAKALKRR